jgi:hypothetical protein
MTQHDADQLVAEARRAVHESLTLLPAGEADRVRSLIADLETAVEGRAAMRAATPPPSGGTHGLSVQHADALWDAIATPGPHRETYVEQHKRVCHAVARILEELTPDEEPATDRAAALSPAERTMLRYALDQVQKHIWSRDGFTDEDQAAIDSLRRVADEAQPAAEARPPRHAWRVETRDPLANEWAPGSHFLNRQHAVERYETANSRAPWWEDGTPVERRIVRETTTYTVEHP